MLASDFSNYTSVALAIRMVRILGVSPRVRYLNCSIRHESQLGNVDTSFGPPNCIMLILGQLLLNSFFLGLRL